jgi:protein TonB
MMDHPPRVVSGRPPEYPERARDRGVEGTVIALITIDTLGRVLEAKVEKSAGSDLDKSVLKAVQQTRFQAAVVNGRRVPSKFRRPYEFRLEG